MQTGLTAGVMLILAGTVGIWGINAAAASGRVGRNGFVGIRLGSTLSSNAAWIAGHRAALPASRLAASLSLIGGAATIVASATTQDEVASTLFWALVFLGYGAVLFALIVAVVRAGRAATVELHR